VVTVAAGLRHFAFLNYLTPRSRKSASEQLCGLGFQTCVFSPRFDLDFKVPGVSEASANAYRAYKIRNDRFLGLGVWPNRGQRPTTRSITLTNLGSVLTYPECCVHMDVETKRFDHKLFLRALVNEVGDDPDQVTRGLRRKCEVEKGSQSHLRNWSRRWELTMARFPFALHTACDDCLESVASPTAMLSASYEHLAHKVSEELHFLVRWASHVVSGGRGL
jgi:hypothetical protein